MLHEKIHFLIRDLFSQFEIVLPFIKSSGIISEPLEYSVKLKNFRKCSSYYTFSGFEMQIAKMKYILNCLQWFNN